MATAETRTGLIGLSVAMLGQAPGTGRLNEWVEAVDGGMSLSDLANHIADSDGFQATYPAFLTNGEFAEDFLGNVLGGNVSDALMAAVAGTVEGLLNDGMSRGELALAVVGALHDIADAGEDHAAYADLGMAAMAFANQVAVASHYTLEARMADPSADALAGVTADADSATMAIDAIDNPPAPPGETGGQKFMLTPTIDDIKGGDADDMIIAQPVAQVSNVFRDVLNPFDTIDGGGGVDTIHIFGVDPTAKLNLGAEAISNVENVVINTVGGIDADLTDWDGVEMVDLRRFGSEGDVTLIVDDGATVSTSQTFRGDVTLVGSAGDVSIKAGGSSEVHVGSAGQTETVTVMGGGNVTIDNGAGKQSQTVTRVSATGVAHNTGTEEEQASGTFVPMTDRDGFVVGDDGSTRVTINTGATDTYDLVRVNNDGVFVNGALVPVNDIVPGGPITVTITSWDHDSDADSSTPPLASVIVELKFDGSADGGGIVFGDIVSIDGGGPDDDDFPEGVKVDIFNGDALSSQGLGAVTSRSIGREDAAPETVPTDAAPTLTINSDAIADLTLASTTATILVHNNSKTADGKNMPEDLSITLNKYGSFNPNGSSKVVGKLCVAGAGSAEDIMLTVAGDSNVDLNSNAVKMLDIDADAKLSLSVSKFNAAGMPDGPSETLAGVTVSGAGAVSMDSLAGMKKLASIDASESSGKNSFKSTAELAALTMVEGGSGGDTVGLATSLRGKLESVDTGDGADTVMISGDYRDGGLMVDLGADDDTFHGNDGNSESRIDGGDGRDTLRLSADGATYKDGDKTMSIYSNFEILDVGGGQGKYDVERLGIDTIVINKDTAAAVELNNVGGGTHLNVSAEKAGTGTKAEVDYNFADDVNVAGSIIDGGTTNVLNVSLMARGGSRGTKAAPGNGAVELTITLDEDLVAMAIDSNASVHRTAAGKGVTSGHYENEVTVGGTSSALEEVKITGDAMTNLSGTGLTSLQYVNATESGAGVTVNASNADAARVRLAGSDHKDELTAGDFDGTAGSPLALTARNILMGNGGDDTLTGGAGRDILNGGAGADKLSGGDTDGSDVNNRFVYNAASESMVTFSRNKDNSSVYDAKGYDVIMDFTTGTDHLHFSKALHAIVTAGNVRAPEEWGGGTGTGLNSLTGSGWKPVDDDGTPGGDSTATVSIDGDGTGRTTATGAETDDDPDGGAANLFDFIGDGKGLFLTTVVGPTTDQGSTTRTVKNSIAMINQTATNSSDETSGEGTWLLFDIDADGNFDADTDMVIFLVGDTTGGSDLFAATTDIEM